MLIDKLIKKFLKNKKIHSKVVPYLDLLFLLRPVSFFAVWVMICVGMYLSSLVSNSFGFQIDLFITDFNFSTIMTFIGLTLLISSISIMNQIFDKKSDQINNKLFLLNGRFDIEFANNVHNFLLLISILILLVFDWKVSMLGLLIYFIGYVYNKEPFEFKKSPIYGFLCNVLTGFLLLFSGFMHSMNSFMDVLDINFLICSVPYIFLFAAVSVLSHIPDIEGDKDGSRNTLAIKLGIRKSVLLSTLFVLMSFFISLLIKDPLASTALITIIPFFMYALFRGYSKDILRAIRYPIAILNIYVMCLYPYLAVSVIVTFYLSKYYYWHRYDLHYPTILVDD